MDYLPKNATIEEACRWLHAKTGQTWTLPRLLECGLVPHFWIDFKPGCPAIFGDRIEGYQARVMFHGDLHRLEADSGDALVNMFTAHDGSLLKAEPGLRIPLSELRFKRESLERVSERINSTAPTAAAPAVETISQRNARWLAVFDEEKRTGPEVGAQTRAIDRIAAAEGVTKDTAKKAIQKAAKARAESYRAGGVTPIKSGKNTVNSVFDLAKPRGRAAR